MVMARGRLDAEEPHIFEANVHPDTYRHFSRDRAWTGNSFGERILTVAIPATLPGLSSPDVRQIRFDWQTIRRTIGEAPELFESMIRNVSQ